MFTNLILNTDSYKASHFLQYPAGADVVSSNNRCFSVCRHS